MRKLLAVFYVALMCGLVDGQNPTPGQAISPTGTTPSGSCSGNFGWLVAGNIYTCQNGAWAQASGGGGLPAGCSSPSTGIIDCAGFDTTGSGAGQYGELCAAPSTVTTPASGTVTLFCDSTNANAPSAMLSDRTVQVLAPIQSNNVIIGSANPPPTDPFGQGSLIAMDYTTTVDGLNFIGFDIDGTLTNNSGATGVFGMWDHSTVNAAGYLNYYGYLIAPTLNGAAYYASGLNVVPTVSGGTSGNNLYVITTGNGNTGYPGSLNADDGTTFGNLVAVSGALPFYSGCTVCYSMEANLSQITATIGEYDAFQSDFTGDGASTATLVRQIHLMDPGPGIGTVTNNYGIVEETGVGNNGFGVADPTAVLELQGGGTAAGSSILKFDTGSELTTPEHGAWEYTGLHLYFTTSDGTRHTII